MERLSTEIPNNSSDVPHETGSPGSPCSDVSDGFEDFFFVSQILCPNFFRDITPRHTSSLQGNEWVAELINGHDGRFYDNLRMTKDIFFALCDELKIRGLLKESQNSKVSIIEEVALFMQTVGLHHRQRDSSERFQHSSETINRHIRRVLKAINCLATEVISPPNFGETPEHIINNNEFYPYFKDCVGAVDGTIISAWAPAHRHNSYRSRKSIVSQNVLAACDFDMMFTYVYADWEGSANDARVLMSAITSDPSFPIPSTGKYYLVDSGYTNFTYFLAPYRQTRYHMNEYRGANRGPISTKELFNHRHAKLRNVIERCFGVLKKRFPILAWGMPNYFLTRQTQLVIACCALHNFIRKYSRDDEIFNTNDDELEDDGDSTEPIGNPTQEEIDAQAAFRDAIAQWMWADYGH